MTTVRYRVDARQAVESGHDVPTPLVVECEIDVATLTEEQRRLIAAAPDLLQILQDYLKWHERAIPEDERDCYEIEHLMPGARAAIAKATT